MTTQAAEDTTQPSLTISQRTSDGGPPNYSAPEPCKNRGRGPIFAQALPHDGALTWEVPERLEDGKFVPSEGEGASRIAVNDILEGQRHVLGCVYFDHLCKVVGQLLKGEGVQNEEVWKPVLVDLARQAASLISPQAATSKGVLDPRQHVKVALLPDMGSPGDSFVMQGVMLRKNIPLKGMRRKISNPRILLLGGALELESSKLEALNTMVQQELAFLRSAVAGVSACKPDILVVERSVAKFAVQALESEDITLVSNVTAENLQKLAINLDAQIVESISEITEASLGTCKDFSVNAVRSNSKGSSRGRRPKIPPLMVFGGCPNDLACSIVLKGDSQAQLDALARVLEFATYATYYLRLERAFLLDEMVISTATMAAAVEDFPADVNREQWECICRGLILSSIRRAQTWNEAPITSVSPHTVRWSSACARTPVHQPKEYMIPSFDPTIEVSSPILGAPLMPEPTLTNVDWDTMYESLASNIQDDEVGEFPQQDPSARAINEAISAHQMRVQQPPVSVFGNCQNLNGQLSSDIRGPTALDNRLSGGTTLDSQKSQFAFSNSFSSSLYQSGTDLEEMWQARVLTSSEAAESTSNQRDEQLMGIYNSQKFTSNFANRNHRKCLVCEPARVQSINFYGANDCSLENFLMSIAADATNRCPHGCGGGNSSHVRTFLHGGMRVTVSVVSLPCEKELPGDGQLWFWARPKGFSPEPLPSVRRILLSEDAKCISWGQFLDLSCNTQYLEVLGRQLHLEFVRYFGYGRTVACVYQDRIRPYTLSLPTLKLECSMQALMKWFRESQAELFQECRNAYKAIEDALPCENEGGVKDQDTKKTSWVPQIKLEQQQFLSGVNRVINRVTQDVKVASENLVLDCILELNRSRRQLAVNVVMWSAKLQDPNTYAGSLKSDIVDQGDTLSSAIGTQIADSTLLQVPSPVPMSGVVLDQDVGLNPSTTLYVSQLHANEAEDYLQGSQSAPGHFSSPPPGSNLWDGVPPFSVNTPEENGSENDNRTDDSSFKFMSPFAAMIDRPFSPESSWSPDLDDLIERDPSDETRTLSPEPLIRFPAIGPDMEPATSGTSSILRKNSSAGDLQSILDWEASRFLQDSDVDVPPESPPMWHHRRWASDPISPKGEPLLEQLGKRLMFEEQHFDCDPDRVETPLGSSGSNAVLKVNSSLKQQLKPGAVPLTNGILQLSGRSLSTPECDDVVIPFFESEPASIISHVLASIAYQRDLKAAIDGMHAEIAGDGHAQECPSAARYQDGHTARHSAILRSSKAVHITQKFEDDPPAMPWSQAKFQVVSYYAPQFARLRELCIKGGERSFIMSLSRCKRWQAQGGKSNAYFAKTRDDRYIIKSLSKSEKGSLIDHFGPAYFRHMDEALHENRQVALAKILGVFQVSAKSRTDGLLDGSLSKDGPLEVIVMENVFYNRTMDRTYDLKGSRRSRFSSKAEENPSAKDTVYLDSNLQKHNLSAPPLLVDKASLEGLEEALQRDSKFLADQEIMDYSLLVGLDKEHSTLVVAIIDFIRQYTWDKRLETLAKAAGIIGGKKEGGETPTVISPDLYMKRFVTNITSYFHVVPTSDDEWILDSAGKKDVVESES